MADAAPTTATTMKPTKAGVSCNVAAAPFRDSMKTSLTKATIAVAAQRTTTAVTTGHSWPASSWAAAAEEKNFLWVPSVNTRLRP